MGSSAKPRSRAPDAGPLTFALDAAALEVPVGHPAHAQQSISGPHHAQQSRTAQATQVVLHRRPTAARHGRVPDHCASDRRARAAPPAPRRKLPDPPNVGRQFLRHRPTRNRSGHPSSRAYRRSPRYTDRSSYQPSLRGRKSEAKPPRLSTRVRANVLKRSGASISRSSVGTGRETRRFRVRPRSAVSVRPLRRTGRPP